MIRDTGPIITDFTPVRLYVFRHGETDWNLVRRIQGHTDIALNDQGRQQAHDLARRLQSYPLQALLTSDLSRARETAEIVAAHLNIPLFEDPRFREASLGDVEGLTVDEAVARFGKQAWQTWCSNDPSDWGFSFPNGEPKRSTLARAQAALTDFLKTNAFDNVAISTHGGVIRTMVSSVALPDRRPVAIPNCGVHILDRQSRVYQEEWSYIALDDAGATPDFHEF